MLDSKRKNNVMRNLKIKLVDYSSSSESDVEGRVTDLGDVVDMVHHTGKEASTLKKTKKITTQLKTWKSNIMKQNINQGKSYTTRNNKFMPARKMKDPCVGSNVVKRSTKVTE